MNLFTSASRCGWLSTASFLNYGTRRKQMAAFDRARTISYGVSEAAGHREDRHEVEEVHEEGEVEGCEVVKKLSLSRTDLKVC